MCSVSILANRYHHITGLTRDSKQAWITEMAAFVKSLDGKHLVTVGLEGFYSLNSTGNYGANPGEWAASLGSDFIKNSAIENIDFASVHAYPHSWLVILSAHYDFAPTRNLVTLVLGAKFKTLHLLF